jgi:hypothetical protein
MRIGRCGPSLLALASLCVALSPAAGAETTTVDGGPAPIVRISLQQGTLTIRTWDRESIQIDAESGVLTTEHKPLRVGPSSAPLLIQSARVQWGDSEIVMPAESFLVSSITPGSHDLIKVAPAPGRHVQGNVSVTVPSDTAVVAVTVGRGSVTLRDYRGGTFIIHVQSGQVQLQSVGGDGFVQTLQGTVLASDSNFNRLRVRTAIGNQIFQHCRAKQIEAWSVESSVVYDAGTFEPGLARFESTEGNVAIGVTAGTQLVGRAGGGKVYTLFDHVTQVDGRGAEANANYSGGGPLVNAFSASGGVYLYDGGLALRRKLPREWKQVLLALRNDPSVATPPAPRHDAHPDAQATTQPFMEPRPMRRPHSVVGPYSGTIRP